MERDYRWVATSLEGFIQQIAVSYIRNGYVFFVRGEVPKGRDPREIDRKLLSKYDIEMGKGKRYSRKKRGLANLQYIRFQRTWVMLATPGEHEWFTEEQANIKDVRRVPLLLFGYSLTLVHGGFVRNRDKANAAGPAERDNKRRVRVQISSDALRDLEAELLPVAHKRNAEWLRMRFYHIGFEPYAPIRKQLLNLLRQVNKRRAAYGQSKIKPDCIRYRRVPVKPFELLEHKEEERAA